MTADVAEELTVEVVGVAAAVARFEVEDGIRIAVVEACPVAKCKQTHRHVLPVGLMPGAPLVRTPPAHQGVTYHLDLSAVLDQLDPADFPPTIYRSRGTVRKRSWNQGPQRPRPPQPKPKRTATAARPKREARPKKAKNDASVAWMRAKREGLKAGLSRDEYLANARAAYAAVMREYDEKQNTTNLEEAS